MSTRARRALLLSALLSAVSTHSWPNPSEKAMSTPDRQQALARFIAKKKFVEEAGYPGATNEPDRLRYEAMVNDLARSLGELAPADQTKPVVLEMFKPTMEAFENADSEERDRFLLHLKELMVIFGIDSSDGVLNKWRYGFDPNDSMDVINANALVAMTVAERELLKRLEGMTAANAGELLRSVLGQPATDTNLIKMWFLTPDASSAMGLTMQGGAVAFVWMAKGRFMYSRRL